MRPSLGHQAVSGSSWDTWRQLELGYLEMDMAELGYLEMDRAKCPSLSWKHEQWGPLRPLWSRVLVVQ